MGRGWMAGLGGGPSLALAVALLVAFAHCDVTDDGDVVSLPVHDEHLLDYVTMLVDEYAPDHQETEARAAIKEDEQKNSEAQDVLTKAKKVAAKFAQQASSAKKAAAAAETASDKEQKAAEHAHLHTDHDKARALALQQEVDAVKASKKKMKVSLKAEELKIEQFKKTTQGNCVAALLLPLQFSGVP